MAQGQLTRFASAVLLLAAAARVDSVPPLVSFEDVGPNSGVDFVLLNSATPEKHQVETVLGGVALFDYDGDGLPDLYFTNGAPQPSLVKSDPKWWNSLYRNLGGGRF